MVGAYAFLSEVRAPLPNQLLKVCARLDKAHLGVFASSMPSDSTSHRQSLHRHIGTLGVLLLTLSIASPGASVFQAGLVTFKLTGTSLVVGALLGFGISVIISLIYAELAASFPHAGGMYAPVGEVLGPHAGFVVQILWLVGGPTTPAFFAFGIAGYIHFLVPLIPTYVLAMTAIVLATMMSILNLRTNSWITGAFLSFEVIGIIIFSGLCLMHPARSLGEVLLHPVIAGQSVAIPASFSTIGMSVVLMAGACGGAGTAAFFGEEMCDAKRRIGRVVLLAAIIMPTLVCLPLVLFAMSASDLQSAMSAETPFADFIAKTGGEKLRQVINLGVAASIFNALLACIIGWTRVFYSTGRDRLFPEGISRFLVRVHSRFHSPWGAALLLGAISIAACALGERFIYVLSSGEVYSTALIGLSALIGRRRRLTGQNGIYRTPLFPMFPLLLLLWTVITIGVSYEDPENGRPGMFIWLAVIGLASWYYRFVLKPKSWSAHIPSEQPLEPLV